MNKIQQGLQNIWPVIINQQGRSFIFIVRSDVFLSVEDVMLDHEDDVEKDADIAQQQLDRVARDSTPVVLKRRVNDELHD